MLIHVTDLTQPPDDEGIQHLWCGERTYRMRWNENGDDSRPVVSVWEGDMLRYTCELTPDVNYGWVAEDWLSGLPMLSPARAGFFMAENETVLLAHRVGSSRLYAWLVTGFGNGPNLEPALTAVEDMYVDGLDPASVVMLAGLQGITVSMP